MFYMKIGTCTFFLNMHADGLDQTGTESSTPLQDDVVQFTTILSLFSSVYSVNRRRAKPVCMQALCGTPRSWKLPNGICTGSFVCISPTSSISDYCVQKMYACVSDVIALYDFQGNAATQPMELSCDDNDSEEEVIKVNPKPVTLREDSPKKAFQ